MAAKNRLPLKLACAGCAVLSALGVTFLLLVIWPSIESGELLHWLMPRGRAHSGWSAEWLGDCDGDGAGDFVLCTAFESDGRARLFSGADGRMLHVIEGVREQTPDWRLAIAAGDVDGDSRADVLFSNYRTTSVISGSTFRAIASRPNERAQGMAPAGDIDADGHADWIVANSFNDEHGERARVVRVISGRDQSVLFEQRGSTDDYFGWSVGGLGDTDGDRIDDFAFSAHDDVLSSSRICVVSGATRRTRLTLEVPSQNWGAELAAAGDIDHDGSADILVAPAYDSDSVGKLYVYSGRDGTELHAIIGVDSRFATLFDGVGDIDADGYDDIGVGTWDSCFVYSGRTGSVLRTLEGATLGYGSCDLDHDGHADLLITRNVFSAEREGPEDELWDRGTLEIISGRDGSVLRRLDSSNLR